MGSDTILSSVVHLLSSNLNLHRSAVWSNYRSVKRLVKVELRHRYVVFETAWHWIPVRVHRTQDCVAVTHLRNNDSYSYQVIDVVELPATNNHLLINGVILLRPTRYFPFDLVLFKVFIDSGDNSLNKLISLWGTLADKI